MHFLVVIERKVDQFSASQIQPLLEPEAERARELYSQGVFRAIWSLANENGTPRGAVVEMEGEDSAQVHTVLETLPMAQAGILNFQLLPLLPYRGFGPRR